MQFGMAWPYIVVKLGLAHFRTLIVIVHVHLTGKLQHLAIIISHPGLQGACKVAFMPIFFFH